MGGDRRPKGEKARRSAGREWNLRRLPWAAVCCADERPAWTGASWGRSEVGIGLRAWPPHPRRGTSYFSIGLRAGNGICAVCRERLFVVLTSALRERAFRGGAAK